MDTHLNDCWRAGSRPFDGVCIHLSDWIPLDELRRLLSALVDVLRRECGASVLLAFNDWHEHDGYVTEATHTNWESINSILASDESLYTARDADEYVRCAYYAEDGSFLLRFYVLEEDDNPEYPGIWGDCDLCGSLKLIETARDAVPESVARKVKVTEAKDYFDANYAG